MKQERGNMDVEYKMSGDRIYKSVKVARMDTKNKILSIADLTKINLSENNQVIIKEKVSFQGTEYGENKESVNVQLYMDLDDFMLLAYDVVNQRPVDRKEYKGSKSDKYSTGYEARIFTMSDWKEGNRGKGAYNISLSKSEGTVGDLGQVSPVSNAPVVTVKIAVPYELARTAFLSAYNYFNNKQTAGMVKFYTALFQE